MVSIKSFTKGDWISFAYINETDGHYILDKTYFLYFLTDTRCLIGKDKEYSNKDVSWFNLDCNTLEDTKIIKLEDFIDKVNNYSIEPLKYKRKNDKYWSRYKRSKKDYNYKYDIANGINSDWVMFKKSLMESYKEELHPSNFKDKQTYNCLVNSFDIFIDELNPVCNTKSTFNVSRIGFGDINFKKKLEYYDVMLNNYSTLKYKHGYRVLTDIYYMLLDFEKLINYALASESIGDADKEAIRLVLKGMGAEKIADNVNMLHLTKKPLTPENIELRLTVDIPCMLMRLDGELNG